MSSSTARNGRTNAAEKPRVLTLRGRTDHGLEGVTERDNTLLAVVMAGPGDVNQLVANAMRANVTLVIRPVLRLIAVEEHAQTRTGRPRRLG